MFNDRKHPGWLAVAMGALIAIALWGCSSPPALPLLPGDAVVLAFGDSLTFGTGAAESESYPAVLESMIGRRVVNAGIAGDVTGEALLRLPEALDRERPALMLLCIGGNDLLRKLDRKRASDNIREMIRLARERNVAVVLIAVPAPGLLLSPAAMYEEIAEEMAVPLEAEAVSDILGDNRLKSDYIHPNAAGYRRLADAVAALLRERGATN